MVFVVVVAAAWMVILGPNLVKRRSRLGGAGSISHFHRQQHALKQATPSPIVSPAYRLRPAPLAGNPEPAPRYPDVATVPVLTVEGADRLPRPALAFLGDQPGWRDAAPAAWSEDGIGSDLARHERHLRRQVCRRRRETLATLTIVFALSALVGCIPGANAALVVAAFFGAVLALYVTALIRVRHASVEGGVSMSRGATVHALDPAARSRATPIGAVGVPVYMSGRFAHPSNQAVAVR